MTLTKFKNLVGETSLDKLTKWANGRPIYTQIKYNGVFCRWSKTVGAAFTGTGKAWDLARFPVPLQEFLNRSPYDLYGELLIPYTHLPEIAGAVNVNSTKPFPNDTLLHVFDIFDPAEPWLTQPISARLQMMNDLNFDASPNIRIANTWLLPADKADSFFTEIVSQNHEGLVYRRDPCFPVFNDTPHPDMVKRKRIYSAEGKCIEVVEGKGKRRGMLGYMILQLKDGRPLKIGGGPGMTDDLLYSLYNNPPIGEQITFTYEELAPSGIPLRPQFSIVRDYE